MSSVEEEYDGTDDEEEFEFDEGEGDCVVDWEDDDGEARTSQAVLDILIESSSKEEEEEDIDESLTDYSDDDVIDVIKMEI
ncbi:hypothetical protein GIB67_030117 [Kingdonia uniflora]|uniref:Uncharacterized protein n=1 Tax=Kingdonia uniflora TaxID=39325 RepID=A0A7J7L2N9_9MAGN|nr:hypothetical protein GIB67_030117 [Kingdonia uniflora]